MDVRELRYGDVVAQVLATPGPVRLVGVDGLGGAGKSTFAARLAAAAGGAPVVHTDDFASHDVPMQWWPRMLHEVVEPLLRGDAASYRAYDWVARRFSATSTTVRPAPLVVLEGVGATRAAWRDRLALSVWVECPRELRLRRGLERDGEELREFWESWMRAEDDYVATEHPADDVDVVVDGAPATPPTDPAATFVGTLLTRRASLPPG